MGEIRQLHPVPVKPTRKVAVTMFFGDDLDVEWLGQGSEKLAKDLGATERPIVTFIPFDVATDADYQFVQNAQDAIDQAADTVRKES